MGGPIHLKTHLAGFRRMGYPSDLKSPCIYVSGLPDERVTPFIPKPTVVAFRHMGSPMHLKAHLRAMLGSTCHQLCRSSLVKCPLLRQVKAEATQASPRPRHGGNFVVLPAEA